MIDNITDCIARCSTGRNIRTLAGYRPPGTFGDLLGRCGKNSGECSGEDSGGDWQDIDTIDTIKYSPKCEV